MHAHTPSYSKVHIALCDLIAALPIASVATSQETCGQPPVCQGKLGSMPAVWCQGGFRLWSGCPSTE